MALYSNTLAVMRQYLSSAVGDLILSTAGTPLSSTLYTDSSLLRADDYYNDKHYRAYCYAGTAIGQEREVYDWVFANRNLIFTPAFSPALVEDDTFELHYIFTEGEYRKAINLAIETLAGKYLVDVKDETTIRLTSTTDNLSNTVYTYEYALPTSLLYLHNVVKEEALSGVKLTGTVDAAFTAGETVTGGTSLATGEQTYDDGSTYVRLRKVSGTFVVGEDATGATSTCATIEAVESEVAGGDRFLIKDTIDPRDWSITKAYAPYLKLRKGYVYIDEDLYLRLEGQGTQPIVDDDTDVIYLPPDWVVQKAITFLPQNKIQSNNLDATYRQALILSAREPRIYPDPRAQRVVE